MLESLKFCQGSIAKKDFVAELKHFSIKAGRVRGFNGILALSSPIPFDIDCKPKAETLVKAISNCNDTVQLNMTPAGRLSIKSGVFKAFIDCIQEDTIQVEPEGEDIVIDGSVLLKGLKIVAPFMANDASRSWANGVLIKGQSMFATNNVTIVEYWHGTQFPHVVNIPRAAVKELLRINEEPLYAQVSENNITFHFTNNKWLRTQLYVTTWPNIGRILDNTSQQASFDETLFLGLESIKSFVDKAGTVFFRGSEIRTHEDDSQGASFQLTTILNDGKYNIEMLNLLKGVATTIDWSAYPDACLFQGERLRGAIIGMRK